MCGRDLVTGVPSHATIDRMRILTALLLTLLACGDDKTPCAKSDPTGLYLVTFKEHPGGTCGDREAIVPLGGAESDDGSVCTDSSVESADSCSVELNQMCTEADGSTSKLVGTLTQVDGPKRIEGVLDITLRDAPSRTSCHGVSDVTYVRQ